MKRKSGGGDMLYEVNRQTTDEVDIEGVGRGRLTWNHGPAKFECEGHPTLDVAEFDGFGKVVLADGFLRADVKVLVNGDRHERHYSPLFGEGWLVSEVVPRDDGGNDHYNRFEDEEGNVKVRFKMVAMCVGRPAYKKVMELDSEEMPPIEDPDEFKWHTYTSSDGSVLAFRRGGKPPPRGSYDTVKPWVYAMFTDEAKALYDARTRA